MASHEPYNMCLSHISVGVLSDVHQPLLKARLRVSDVCCSSGGLVGEQQHSEARAGVKCGCPASQDEGGFQDKVRGGCGVILTSLDTFSTDA